MPLSRNFFCSRFGVISHRGQKLKNFNTFRKWYNSIYIQLRLRPCLKVFEGTCKINKQTKFYGLGLALSSLKFKSFMSLKTTQSELGGKPKILCWWLTLLAGMTMADPSSVSNLAAFLCSIVEKPQLITNKQLLKIGKSL